MVLLMMFIFFGLLVVILIILWIELIKMSLEVVKFVCIVGLIIWKLICNFFIYMCCLRILINILFFVNVGEIFLIKYVIEIKFI